MESWRLYKTNDIQSPSMSKRTLVNAQRHVQQHQARAGRLGIWDLVYYVFLFFWWSNYWKAKTHSDSLPASVPGSSEYGEPRGWLLCPWHWIGFWRRDLERDAGTGKGKRNQNAVQNNSMNLSLICQWVLYGFVCFIYSCCPADCDKRRRAGVGKACHQWLWQKDRQECHHQAEG